MNRFIHHPMYAGRSAQDPQVKKLFGLNPKAKWPNDGMPKRTIQGVTAWVAPLDLGFKLRAKCNCPVCGKTMAIGRLAQHSKVHA